MAEDVEVSRLVGASVDRVWELVGDPTRIGEISPECYRTKWLGRASGPAPGAQFLGFNKKGLLRWPTRGTIASYEPGREIAWDVDLLGQPVARWGFRLVPEDGGTRVVQTWQDKRSLLANVVGRARTNDSPSHNRAGMEQTLERLRIRLGA